MSMNSGLQLHTDVDPPEQRAVAGAVDSDRWRERESAFTAARAVETRAGTAHPLSVPAPSPSLAVIQFTRVAFLHPAWLLHRHRIRIASHRIVPIPVGKWGQIL